MWIKFSRLCQGGGEQLLRDIIKTLFMPHHLERFNKKESFESPLSRGQLFDDIRKEIEGGGVRFEAQAVLEGVLERLFEHNISDAIDFCEQYSIDPDTIALAISPHTNFRMVVKHYRFQNNLFDKIRSIRSLLTGHDKERQQFFFADKKHAMPHTPSDLELSWWSEMHIPKSQEKIINEIDRYYAQQLSLREFKAPKNIDETEVAVDNAETVVRGYLHMYGRDVHRNQVVQLLLQHLKKWAMPGAEVTQNNYLENIPLEIQVLLLQDYISPAEMERIITAFENGLRIPLLFVRESLMKEFYEHTARPLNVVVEAAKTVASTGGRGHQGIPALLNESLKKRGIATESYELARDGITGLYEFKIKEGKETQAPQQISFAKFLDGKYNTPVEKWDSVEITSYGAINVEKDPNGISLCKDVVFYYNNLKEFPTLFQQDNHRLRIEINSHILAKSLIYPAVIVEDASGIYLLHYAGGMIVKKSIAGGKWQVLWGNSSDTYVCLATFQGEYIAVNYKTGQIHRSTTHAFISAGNSLIAKDPRSPSKNYHLEEDDKKIEFHTSGAILTVGEYNGEKIVVTQDNSRCVYANDVSLFVSDASYRYDVAEVRDGLVILSCTHSSNELDVWNLRTNKKCRFPIIPASDAGSPLTTAPSIEVVNGIPRFILTIKEVGGIFRIFEEGTGFVAPGFGVSMAMGSTRVTARLLTVGPDGVSVEIRDNGEVIENHEILLPKKLPHDQECRIRLDRIADTIIVNALQTTFGGDVVATYPLCVIQKKEGAKNSTPSLQESEQYLLDLLNVSQQPSRERVLEFVKKYKFDDDVSDLDTKKKKAISERINDILKMAAHSLPMAKELFKTMSAYPSDGDSSLVDRTINLLFPELVIQRASSKAPAGQRRETSKGLPLNYGPDSGLSRDPRDKSGEAICEMRDTFRGFVPNQIDTRYDGKWHAPDKTLPLAIDEKSLVHETTATEPFFGNEQVLLMPIGAKLIDSRVKCFDTHGQELLDVPQISYKGGIYMIQRPRKAASVTYSYAYASQEFVPTKSSEAEYRRFAEQMIRAGVADTNPFAVLPPECRLFLRDIVHEPPHIRLQKIEEYVRKIAYYDFDFAEVSHFMQGKNITERFPFLRSRMAQLRKRKPELHSALKEKIFACTCADASQITTALLQASGFVAGRMGGYLTDGKSIHSSKYHSVAFVLWPTEKIGECQIVKVDGTPRGVTAQDQEMLEFMQQPSLKEFSDMSGIRDEEKEREAYAEFERIVAAIADKDPELIKKMTNGLIESAVNAVLTVEARHADAQVIQHVADVLLYSPVSLDRVDWNSITEKTAIMKFVDEEISRERVRGALHSDDTRPGVQILQSFETFVKKYDRRYPHATAEQALDALQHVYDLLKNNFTPVEYRIATVVITYLKAKKMRG